EKPPFGFRKLIDIAPALVSHPIERPARAGLELGRKCIEQGRLARAALAHNGKHFAGIKLDAHIGTTQAGAIMFGEIFDTEEGFSHGRSPSSPLSWGRGRPSWGG